MQTSATPGTLISKKNHYKLLPKMCLETPGVASDRYIPHSFQIVSPSLPIKNQCTNKPRTTQLFLLVAATDPNAFGFSLIPKLFCHPWSHVHLGKAGSPWTLFPHWPWASRTIQTAPTKHGSCFSVVASCQVTSEFSIKFNQFGRCLVINISTCVFQTVRITLFSSHGVRPLGKGTTSITQMIPEINLPPILMLLWKMGCLQDKFPENFIAIFHWTMILGERVPSMISRILETPPQEAQLHGAWWCFFCAMFFCASYTFLVLPIMIPMFIRHIRQVSKKKIKKLKKSCWFTWFT